MRPIDQTFLMTPDQRRAVRYSAKVRRRRALAQSRHTELTLRLLIAASGLFLLSEALAQII